jgi:uncharacterized membrane protein
LTLFLLSVRLLQQPILFKVFLESFIDWGFSKELAVLIVSALPVVELRGAIPVAIVTFDIPWQTAFFLAYIGNIFPVAFILLFLNKFIIWLDKFDWAKRRLKWFFQRTKKRGGLIEKYKHLGLIAFVAIPLPITGAWTGATASVLFGIPFPQAFISILVGVFIAGVIVTILTMLGWVGAVITGGILLGLVALRLSKNQQIKNDT